MTAADICKLLGLDPAKVKTIDVAIIGDQADITVHFHLLNLSTAITDVFANYRIERR